MELVRGIHNLQPHHFGCVLTIGNFDGVHRGHQTLLTQLKQQGEKLGLPVMVMIFEPQPQEVFMGDAAPARLTALREKVRYLTEFGVDTLLCVNFDKKFGQTSAEDFISHLLVEKLGVKFLAIGDDFRFGAGRKGDFTLLKQAGQRAGFDVINSETYCENQQRISSTAVRQALESDDLALAETLLGRPYSISGRVVHGAALGRTLGFPTANVPLKRQVVPINGVYAVDVYGIDSKPLPGVANIGKRPTLSGLISRLEVHLLDFNCDLYGKHITVVLKKKIRNEQRFASLDDLKAQIAKDVVTTRDYFSAQ